MKPVLIAAAAIAIVAAVAVLTGRFRDHAYSPAELAEEDEAQARWAGLVAESKGRVLVRDEFDGVLDVHPSGDGVWVVVQHIDDPDDGPTIETTAMVRLRAESARRVIAALQAWIDTVDGT